MTSSQRSQKIIHKGKEIIILDISGLQNEEVVEPVSQAKELIMSSQKGSVLLFTDLTDYHYGQKSLELAKQFAKDNKEWVKKSGMIGVDGLKKIAFKTMSTFSGRDNIKIFNTKEEALDWLVED